MLSFTTIFLAVAEMGFALPNYSTLSFFGVYGSKFTKFSALIKHLSDCLPYKFYGGLQHKIFGESQKNQF